jgi:poly(A) polymerase
MRNNFIEQNFYRNENRIYIKNVSIIQSFYNCYLEYLMKIYNISRNSCYIYGGWICDRFLNIPISRSINIDFLVDYDLFKFGCNFAAAVEGDLIRYKKLIFNRFKIGYFNVVTVEFKDSNFDYQFDFCHLKKGKIDTLVKELKTKDFTINAMAIDLLDIINKNYPITILDPTEGEVDIKNKNLKPISLISFKRSSVVHILRGYRIAITKNLKMSNEFLKLSKQKKFWNINSGMELFFTMKELQRICSDSNGDVILEELRKLGILSVILKIGHKNTVDLDMLRRIILERFKTICPLYTIKY